MTIRVLDLFSGIGGFSLGLERAGMETVAFVEIDEYCQKVLKKHWPDVPIFSDIKTFGRSVFGETVDLICGGFPCQPFSVAGKRNGTNDNRHLWPEMLRVIQEYKPSWVVAENVRGILSIEQGMVFEQACLDLEGEGYEVQPFIIPACAVNAPHRRDRVWIVANLQRLGWETRTREGIQPQEQITKGQDAGNINTERIVADPTGEGLEGQMWEKQSWVGGRPSPQDRGKFDTWDKNWYEIATRFCRVADGVSNRVDRLKCLGNAVVPQIVEIIGRTIITSFNNC